MNTEKSPQTPLTTEAAHKKLVDLVDKDTYIGVSSYASSIGGIVHNVVLTHSTIGKYGENAIALHKSTNFFIAKAGRVDITKTKTDISIRVGGSKLEDVVDAVIDLYKGWKAENC